jgi:putative ABC transport system permease protein
MDFVSDGYLEALGARLLSGRLLGAADNRLGGPRVAVISETTARTLYPGENPIGRQIRVANDLWEIVGVIRDVVDRRLDVAHRPFAYMPQAFNVSRFSIVVRTPTQPLALVPRVLSEIRGLDGGVALANPRTLDEAMAGSMTERRVVLSLVGTFATAALTLACIGLYGVMAYSVATRRREICIRMAVGAVGRDVTRHILKDGLRLVAVGLAIGVAAAMGGARLLTTELYQVRSSDPLVIAGTIVAVAGVSLLACWMPAWRATRFTPLAALRND